MPITTTTIRTPVTPVTSVIDGLIALIRQNIIAKTNVISDVTTGDIQVSVQNSFSFNENEEIILIDYDYNVEGSPHYQVYEYAVIDEVVDTHTISLQSNVISTWLVSNHAFVQKTIGHSPLYDDRVYYGDREVIPTEDMAITVEPVSLSNEWIWIPGGLSQEYRVSIIVYGKDIETEDGMKILNKYTDSLYELFVASIHMDLTNYNTPLVANVSSGTITVLVADTLENRQNFTVTNPPPWIDTYEIQDNKNVEIDLVITAVTYLGNGTIEIKVSRTYPPAYGVTPLQNSYNINEYAVFIKHGIYLYDSRIDNIEYGTVQKGSAFIRAARLNWFGKEVKEYRFPQQSRGISVDYSQDILGLSSSSSSSSSSP